MPPSLRGIRCRPGFAALTALLVVLGGANGPRAEEPFGDRTEQPPSIPESLPEAPPEEESRTVRGEPEEPLAEPQAEPDAERVGEVRVAAPPVVEGTRVDRNAVQVTSVSEEQIQGLNAQDLTGALRRVPGVTISRYNAIGSFGGADGGAIFIRGHGSGRPGAEISTRVDGVPRFVGVWTHPLLDTLNVDIAERVDVYRSAQPVGFGNMSFGAVDVVPKRVSDPGVVARGVAQYGSFDTRVLLGEHGAKVDAFDYFLNLSHRSSDGHRKDADGTVNHIYGRAGYELGENWTVSVIADWTEGDVGNPQREGAPSPPRKERFLTDDWLTIMTVSHEYEKVSGHVKLSLQDGRISWEQWDAAAAEPFDSVTDYTDYGVRARETLRVWEGGELSVGYDLDNFGGEFVERRPSGDVGDTDARFYNTGPYLLASQAFRPGDGELEIVPSAGVRYNQSRYFDGDWGVQAGVRARRADTEVHANYARAFNTPGAYVVTSYAIWGRGDEWKDLDTELLDHVELGVSQEIAPWLSAGITAFYDDVKDAIRFVPPPPAPPLFENIGDYEMAGGEASVEVEPADCLRLFAGSAFLHTWPDDVPNAPSWTVSFGATWAPIERLTINVDGLWVDERYVLNPRYAAAKTAVDDYFLLNARIGYQLSPHVQVFVVGENLTDSDYEYRPGYPMPGIAGLVGMELRL